jgi:signal transduction histidine kinase
VDLVEVVGAIREETASGRECEIRLEATGDMIGTWDRDRLSQLVSNLAANACEHGPPGAPVYIRLDGRRAEQVRLEVKNEGVIPPDILRDLFTPLRDLGDRRGKRRSSSGLGLGLFITQQIALAHGGSIHVQSDDERGTRVVVELPRDAPAGGERVFDADEMVSRP